MNRTRKGGFATHAALSLGAAIAGAVLALATLPYVVSQLGLAAYGLFSLLAVATAYVGMLDMGFSWTTSRFLAEAIERDDEPAVRRVLRAGLATYGALGVVGAALFAGAAPLLVTLVFNTPERLHDEGILAARWFGVAFVFSALQIYAQSVLRGARRFDLGAAVQLTATASVTLSIVAALAVGGGLAAAAGALAAAQAASAAVALVAARWTLADALSVGRVDLSFLRTFGRFSLAVGIGNVGGQLLYVPNRLLVGMLLPVSAAGLFNVPLSLVQRLQVVPGALTSAALPTLTAAVARGDEREFWRTVWRLLGAMGALLLPPLVLAFVWAPTFLGVWFSSEFAGEAATVLRVALVAIVLNAGTAALAVACDSAGLPGIVARATIVAGFVNVLLALVLTWTFGIVGSATAVAAAVALLFVLIIGGWRRAPLPPVRLPGTIGGPRRLAAVAVGAATWTGLLVALEPALDSRSALVVAGLGALAAAYALVTLAFGIRTIATWVGARWAPSER